MILAEVKKLIRVEVSKFINDFGFEFMAFDKTGFLLAHRDEEKILEIGFALYDRPDGYEFSGGAMSVLFTEVELLVFPLLIKHKLWDTTSPPTSYSCTFGSYNMPAEVIDCRMEMASIHIDKEEDVIKYMSSFKKYMKYYAFPWFERYSKLENVNEFINSAGMQDILNCFSAPFPTQFYRAMVITEKCNNTKRTQEIKEECLRRFKECENDSYYTKDTVQSYYNSLQELSDVLKIS